LANQTQNSNMPQNDKLGTGKPNEPGHAPGHQQDQTSGSPGQQGDSKPPAKPQQG
jgi:hypothetical protein